MTTIFIVIALILLAWEVGRLKLKIAHVLNIVNTNQLIKTQEIENLENKIYLLSGIESWNPIKLATKPKKKK